MTNKLKAVQAEAKKLKAKNKRLTHVQALKQAWAIVLKKAPKKAVKKAPARKIGAVKQLSLKLPKKVVPVKAYDRKANHVPATKRAIFGVADMKKHRAQTENELNQYLAAIERNIKILSTLKRNSVDYDKTAKHIKLLKSHLPILKRRLREQNSLINKALK